ncbi:MAG: MBL fold metallo-hydrolase [Planctomycetota bacterium]
MIPKPPAREPGLGFLFCPPYRVQGTSIAGEITTIQVPELDLCFDMGSCPRAALASKYVAISHGHMDHIGGLAYFISQRRFQGMGDATIVCHEEIAKDIERMLAGFNDLERQRTPYELVSLKPEGTLEIKNNIHLRMFELEHTAPCAGYVVVEKRSKLKPEFAELTQEQLRQLRDGGTEITYWLEVPQVAYLTDTLPGPQLVREDVRKAKVVIAECTFVDHDHKQRSRIGKHLHIDDIAEWLPVLECETLVLMHLSRRSNIAEARKALSRAVGHDQARRVEFLMDARSNKIRYERQYEEAERAERRRQATTRS